MAFHGACFGLVDCAAKPWTETLAVGVCGERRGVVLGRGGWGGGGGSGGGGWVSGGVWRGRRRGAREGGTWGGKVVESGGAVREEEGG